MTKRLPFRLCTMLLTAAACASAHAAADSESSRQAAAASVKEWLTLIPKDTFVPMPEKPPPKLPEKITKAFVIPIHGPLMSAAMVDAMKNKVAACKGRGAQIVIFDVNSPGGRLDVMEEIVRLIREDLAGVYTVAYVNPQAISAAAIISLAASEIVMSPKATLGDAMPVQLGPQGYVPIPEKERGKIESAARADIRVQAQLSGYNAALCEAMITLTWEVWLVRNRQSGQLRIVDARDYKGKLRGAPGQDVQAPPDSQWEFLAVIDGPDELVTVTAEEAVAIGFSRHVFESMDDLRKHYNIAGELTVLADSVSEQVATFLTSPLVTVILLTGGLFCVYTELRTPGFGIFGILGIACFAMLFGSRYLIGLAQWWEIGLFAIGLVLIAIELFVTPGFGVMGVSGILCCIVALVAMVVPNPPDKLPIPRTSLDWSVFENGLFALAIGFLLALVAALVAAKYLPQIPIAGRLILVPAGGLGAGPMSESSPLARIKLGDVGAVETMCRPVGKVRFGNDLLDAASEGDIIEAGAKVRVLRREGNHLVVEKIESA